MLKLTRYFSKITSTSLQLQKRFSDLSVQSSAISKHYDPTQHTLLNDIFSYKYYENYLGKIFIGQVIMIQGTSSKKIKRNLSS